MLECPLTRVDERGPFLGRAGSAEVAGSVGFRLVLICTPIYSFGGVTNAYDAWAGDDVRCVRVEAEAGYIPARP